MSLKFTQVSWHVLLKSVNIADIQLLLFRSLWFSKNILLLLVFYTQLLIK
jgi:hypothetical protein